MQCRHSRHDQLEDQFRQGVVRNWVDERRGRWVHAAHVPEGVELVSRFQRVQDAPAVTCTIAMQRSQYAIQLSSKHTHFCGLAKPQHRLQSRQLQVKSLELGAVASARCQCLLQRTKGLILQRWTHLAHTLRIPIFVFEVLPHLGATVTVREAACGAS